MLLTDVSSSIDQARSLAMQQIAMRCKYDLYYLCKNILGYDLMTEQTHKDLCLYAESVHPHSNPKLMIEPVEGITIVSNSLYTPPKKVETLHVHTGIETPPTDIAPPENLYNPEFSGTSKALDVHRIEDTFDLNKNQLLLLMPRGTFKSSVVTIGLSLQMILNDQDIRILIDSETFAKAKAFLAEIKGHLEATEKYREVFKTIYGMYPDAKKRDELWSDSQINIAPRKRQRKEATISCGGVDVTKNGMHYDLIIMDDLHSELNTQNADQIDKVKQHFKLAYSLLDPGCPLIVIGTRWDYKDVYQHILDNYREEFNVLVRSAYNADGSLFFPERLTEKFLTSTRHKQGSYIFSCQYMNEPVDDETATFKASHMQKREWGLVKDVPINWYVSVDPSYEGPYSDYAALVVAGMDFNKNLYVRHIVREKMTYKGIIDKMFDLYFEFEPKAILLETVATQKSIQYELNNEQKRRGTWLPVIEIKSRSKSKEERIRGLAPFYEFEHVFHVSECPQLDVLEDELLHFPKGGHDDVIDAFASILEIAAPNGRGGQRAERRKEKRHIYDVLSKPRSPLTGV